MSVKARAVIGHYQGTPVVDGIEHPTLKWVAKQITGGDHLAYMMSRGKTGYLSIRTPQIVSIRMHFGFCRDPHDESRIAIEAWMTEEDRKIASAHMARSE